MVSLLAKMWGHCTLVLIVAKVLDDGLDWVMLDVGLLLFCVSCFPVLVGWSMVVCHTGCSCHWGGRPSRSSFILRVIMCMYVLNDALVVRGAPEAGSSWLRVHTWR